MADGGGMYLEVMPTGSKYWRLKYRFQELEKRLALGVYPEISLADARNRREAARKQLAHGIDPSADKQEKKKAALLNAKNTFEALAREWHEKNIAKWTEKTAKDTLYRLETYVFPDIGKIPVRDLTAPRLLETIRKIEARPAFDIARRMRSVCEQVFAYGIGTGRADRNIAADLKGTLEAFKRGHFKAISTDQIPEFLAALKKNDARLFPQTIRATTLLMLTFVRTSELIQSTWDEIDLKKAVWEIPAERMKMRKPHTVPLSRQAIEILQEQREHTRLFNTNYVFPSQIEPRKPMSNGTILGAIKRLGYGGKMTGHGFRKLAMSTIKERLGYRHEVPDRQLAHGHRDALAAAYDDSQFLEERTKMMQEWVDYLDGAKEGK